MAIKVNAKDVLDINLGTDIEADASKKTALNLIGDYSGYKFTTDGKTLTISKGNDIITVSNTSKLKYFKSSNDTEYSDIVVSGLFDSVPVVIDWNKRKISGITNYNDTINLSGVELTGAKGFTVDGGKGNDTIIGSMNPDTIKGGDGNDFIYSSKGNDTITGGVGRNTIIYSGKFDTDTINLTKKENLILDLSDYGIESLDDTDKLAAKVIGKDLKLEVIGKGTIILKNYTNNVLNSLNIQLDGDLIENLSVNSFPLNYNDSDFTINEKKKTATITTSKYDDTVKVTDLDEYSKTINTGEGDDTIYSSKGNDTITGGVGRNTIIYSGKFDTDTINLTKKENLILDLSDYGIESLDDTDKLAAKVIGKDLKLEVIGKGTIILKNYTNNVLNSLNIQLDGSLIENLSVNSFPLNYNDSDFTINEKKKTATLTTSKYNDTIKVTDLDEYSKTINTGEGNDYINAGKGDDKLTGGKGGDTFIFNAGDGVDTITDADNTDKIQISNVKAEDLRYGKNGNNLEIFYDDSWDDNNKIIVQNYFKGDKNKPAIFAQDGNVGQIHYSITGKGTINGSKTGNEDIVGSNSNDTVKVTAGENTVEAKGGNDKLYGGGSGSRTTFIFTPGDGADIVNSGKGEDTLQFNAVDLSEISFEQGEKKNNKDLIIKYSDTDKVTVKNYYTVDKQGNITGVNQNNSVKHINFTFAEDTNLIYERTIPSSDLIVRYNDKTLTLKDYYTNNVYSITNINDEAIGTLIDGNLNETYDYSNGCTEATITSNGGVDSLKFTGVLTYTHDVTNDDLIINYGNNQFVTVVDYFKGNHSVKTINGIAIGSLLNNNVNEIYDYSNGCEFYTVISNGNTASLKFTGALTYTHYVTNDDLIINYGNNQAVTVKDYFKGNHSVKTINGQAVETVISNNINETYDYTNGCEFATISSNGGVDSLKFTGGLTYVHNMNNDDLVINYGDEQSVTVKDYFKGNHSAQFINGQTIETAISNNVNEIYDYSNGCTITSITSNGGVDSLKFTGDLTYVHDVTNDNLVIKYNNNKSVTLIDYFKGNHSVKTINGTAIETLITNNVNEIYDYTNGCTVATITSNGGNDSLKFTGNLTYVHDVMNDDLVINYGNNKSVTITDYFAGGHSVKTINGTAIGTLLNNNVNEIYDFANGCEIATITSNGGIDTLKFAANTELVYEHDFANNDLVIKYEDKSVTLKDYFTVNHSVTKVGNSNLSDLISNNINETIYVNNGVTRTFSINGGTDTFVFGNTPNLKYTQDLSNGNLTVENLNDNSKLIINNYFNSNNNSLKIKSGNNTQDLSALLNASGRNIIGTNYSDNITGTNYADTITASKGNDTINGGAGINKYVFSAGDGQDTIINGSGTDTIEMVNTTFEDLLYTKREDDLIIHYGENDKITLENYFNGHSVKNIKIGDITKTLTEIIQSLPKKLFGTEEGDYIYVSNSDNIVIDTKSGNDTIYIGGNVINNSVIYGGSGADRIDISGIGNTIYGGTGNDQLYVSSPYDGGNAVESTNTLVFYKGDGNDRLSSYNENSTIILKFADSSVTELGLEKSGDNLFITYDSGKDSIALQNYLYKDEWSSMNQPNYILEDKDSSQTLLTDFIETYDEIPERVMGDVLGTDEGDYVYVSNGDNIVIDTKGGSDTIYTGTGNFINNSVIYGGSGADRIDISGNGNTIYGGTGNDQLNVSNYDYDGNLVNPTNTLVFYKGDGNDRLSSYDENSTTILKFADSSVTELSLEKSGENIFVTYNSGNDSIALQNYLSEWSSQHNYILEDKDGLQTLLADFMETYDEIPDKVMGDVLGTEEDDYIFVSNSDNIVIDTKGGNDTIYSGAGNFINNSVIYGGSGADRIDISGNGNTIYGGIGNDQLYVSYAYNNDSNAVESTNTLVFYKGDGDDRLSSYDQNSTIILKFADSSVTELSLEKSGEKLVVTYNSGKDSIVIIGYSLGDNEWSMEQPNYILEDKDGSQTSLADFVETYGEIPDRVLGDAFVTEEDNYVLTQSPNDMTPAIVQNVQSWLTSGYDYSNPVGELSNIDTYDVPNIVQVGNPYENIV